MHLSSLGPVSFAFHPEESPQRAASAGCNGMACRLQHPLFTVMAGDVFHLKPQGPVGIYSQGAALGQWVGNY